MRSIISARPVGSCGASGRLKRKVNRSSGTVSSTRNVARADPPFASLISMPVSPAAHSMGATGRNESACTTSRIGVPFWIPLRTANSPALPHCGHRFHSCCQRLASLRSICNWTCTGSPPSAMTTLPSTSSECRARRTSPRSLRPFVSNRGGSSHACGSAVRASWVSNDTTICCPVGIGDTARRKCPDALVLPPNPLVPLLYLHIPMYCEVGSG